MRQRSALLGKGLALLALLALAALPRGARAQAPQVPYYVVTKLAGGGSAAGTAAGVSDNFGTSAGLTSPYCTVLDATTDVMYFSDWGSNRVRSLTTTQFVVTLAGSTAGYVNAVGTAARLNGPGPLDIDAARQLLYVGDCTNNVIRVVALGSLAVSTLAGGGSAGGTAAGFANGVGSAATFSYPVGLSLSPDRLGRPTHADPDYATHADYEAVLWDERLAYLFVGKHVGIVELPECNAPGGES